MAQMNQTTLAGIYKHLWPAGIESLIVGISPTLGLIEKNPGAFKGFVGTGKELAWRVSHGTGASGNYGVAYAQPGNSTVRKPFVTRGRLFATRQLDVESMLAAEGQNAALVSLVKEAGDSAVEELRHRAGSLLLGGSGGSIGQIAAGSNTGSATITLADKSQVINFKPGQRLQAFTTVAGGLLAAGAVVTLTATGVNHQAGTLTATGNWTAGIAGIAVADFLVPEGDFLTVPVGMDAWNPDVLPTVGGGDSFFTVDRGGSVPMAGYRQTFTSGSIDECILTGAAELQQIGGEGDTCFVNPLDFNELNLNATGLQRINKNAVGSNGKDIASVGFQGIVLNGPQGAINVFSDPFMRRRRARLTKLKSWKIWSLGDMFGLRKEGMTADGTMRLAGSDALYMVFGGYWQIVCERPLDSALFILP